ncbi:DUF899 family protein [Phormidium tenue FACHB-886]|nr:DUF899 family protein [Phormidium tenue FACHB-886]
MCIFQTEQKPAHLHLAFTAENRQQVEAFYRAALEAGGKDNGALGLHGISIFYKDKNGQVFHTYSSYARGGNLLLGAYHFLNSAAKSRNEKTILDWVRLHDDYEDGKEAEHCCHSA